MRPSPRLLVLAAAALLLVGCAPAAPAPEPVPSGPVAIDPTPDPDEVEAAIRNLHARYVAMLDDISHGQYAAAAVEGLVVAQAATAANNYRDYVAATPGMFEGNIVSAGVRIERAVVEHGVEVDFVGCEDWSGVVVTPDDAAPYIPLQPPHIAVGRFSASGVSLQDLRITAETKAADVSDCS